MKKKCGSGSIFLDKIKASQLMRNLALRRFRSQNKKTKAVYFREKNKTKTDEDYYIMLL
jgi:hypothetical protein